MAEHSIGDGPALFQSERQREIVMLTSQRGRVEVADLATRFSVTTETIRRDLSELQDQRMLRRVHGGAITWETNTFEPLISVRNDLSDGEKRRLAARAIEELPDNGTCIIDSGSTLNRFAETIPGDQQLRVVTNSLPTAQTLATRDNIEVIAVGGKVRNNTLAMVDAQAIAAVQGLHVDTLFISSDAATAEGGLTTPYREEALLKKAMIAAARRVIALVDHSKFGKDQFVQFARWSDIDMLITNAETDSDTLTAIEALGTTIALT